MTDIVSHDGPRGAPPKKDLPEAFRELLEGLYYANLLFEEKEDTGREGIVTACRAVTWFIAVTHQNPLLAAPLLALAGALQDAENRIANPILHPHAENGHRSRSTLKKHANTIAAVCLEVLVELGAPLEEAASMVARHVDKWRIVGDQDVTAHTIKNWRSHYRALSVDDRKTFDGVRSDLLEHGGRQEVERLLSDGPPGMPKT